MQTRVSISLAFALGIMREPATIYVHGGVKTASINSRQCDNDVVVVPQVSEARQSPRKLIAAAAAAAAIPVTRQPSAI